MTMDSQVQIVGRSKPKTWDDYEQGCLMTFGGGYRNEGHLEAFQHGMRTVFNLLRNEFPPAEVCMAARQSREAEIKPMEHDFVSGQLEDAGTRRGMLSFDTEARVEKCGDSDVQVPVSIQRAWKGASATTISCIRRVEDLTAAIPDGEYRGTWGGYVVRFKVDGKQYEAASSVGIRTQNAPCIVSVRDCLITVRAVGQ